MEETLNILIPSGYEAPTDEQVKAAKKWTLLRNDNAAALSSLILVLLQDAVRKLTELGYKYNCKPEDFQFSQDKELREKVAEVMDNLEDDILASVEEYSLNATEDKKRRNSILPWLLALHSKGAKNLADTLHQRCMQFLYDTEAQIAAMKLAGYKQAKAIGRVLSTMHSVYASPEMFAAFKKKSAARYIKSRGIHYGNIGLSSSGAVNLENFSKQTATMAWMKSQLIDFIEDGAVGYYQLRGSNYPCDICDEEVGLHVGDIENDAYPHAHCMCYRVPIKPKDEDGVTTKKVYPNGTSVRVMDGVKTKSSDYNDLMAISKIFAQQEKKDVTILERIHYKDARYGEVYGGLIGTKYERKCPDLLVGGRYFEYESYQRPWAKRKVGTMLKHGFEQSPNVIIDNNNGASDRYIRKTLMSRMNQGVRIDELWLYENGKLRRFFANGKFIK